MALFFYLNKIELDIQVLVRNIPRNVQLIKSYLNIRNAKPIYSLTYIATFNIN